MKLDRTTLNSQTGDDLMRFADMAMYSAKAAGGNRFVLYQQTQPGAGD